ncbi:MAG TPA: phosphoadenylyl-sulfate reductase [Burkholderiaceae bacterium]|jgi:phosphoadenosine phosphosulfate reductase|nr:phosphoadenylyl-sulfate reductase [Burkholderiaceae bacterium]
MSAGAGYTAGDVRPAQGSAAARAPGERAGIEAVAALLSDASRRHTPLVQVTSLGPEDMVITDIIARHRLPIEVVTIDTGRLPRETYLQLAQAQRRYGPQGTPIRVIFPESAAVEVFVHRYGIDGFYDSPEARKACCDARKVRPLARVLAGKGGWVSGLRRAQSSERASIAERETELAPDGSPRAKINPLAAWTDEQVWAYLRAHDVPVNALHAQGYPSIGCGPCTRAVDAGEDPRSGRWWWEQASVRECGLHVRALQRSRAEQTFAEAVS